MALLAAFGKDTDGATWTVNFLLSKVESNLYSFSSEPALVKDTVRLFIALVDMREKYVQLTKVNILYKICLFVHNNFLSVCKIYKSGTGLYNTVQVIGNIGFEEWALTVSLKGYKISGQRRSFESIIE